MHCLLQALVRLSKGLLAWNKSMCNLPNQSSPVLSAADHNCFDKCFVNFVIFITADALQSSVTAFTQFAIRRLRRVTQVTGVMVCL